MLAVKVPRQKWDKKEKMCSPRNPEVFVKIADFLELSQIYSIESLKVRT